MSCLPHSSTMKARSDALSRNIIGAVIEVHRSLGPGLLESTYEVCLCQELTLRNIAYERQVALPVTYKGVQLDCGYKLDILVEGLIIVELTAVECIEPVFHAQLLTYLRLKRLRLGLFINFNVPILKHGIKRMILS